MYCLPESKVNFFQLMQCHQNLQKSENQNQDLTTKSHSKLERHFQAIRRLISAIQFGPYLLRHSNLRADTVPVFSSPGSILCQTREIMTRMLLRQKKWPLLLPLLQWLLQTVTMLKVSVFFFRGTFHNMFQTRHTLYL